MLKIRAFLNNIILIFGSLFFLVLILEFVVFRFILVAPDMPDLAFVDGMLKYQADQQGVYRVKNEIKARFKINKQGWNSKYDQYSMDKRKGSLRVAVIGDSFVEALQIDYNKSLAEQLEEKTGSDRLQVYRFGISGIPMSQYLYILEHEALKYSPDLVVIVLVHNDFDQSCILGDGEFSRNCLRFQIRYGTTLEEVPPAGYFGRRYIFLRHIATFRYLRYRRQIRVGVLKEMLLGDDKPEKESYQANIDVSDLDKKRLSNRLVTEYVFLKMRDVCLKNNADLLIVMDGDRDAIYAKGSNSVDYSSGALTLNAMAKSAADKYGIRFIDLHQVFKEDFLVNHKKFNFSSDMHWNEYGHEVVAEAIADVANHKILGK